MMMMMMMMMIAVLQRSFLAQENVIQLIKRSQFHSHKFNYRAHKSHLWILGLFNFVSNGERTRKPQHIRQHSSSSLDRRVGSPDVKYSCASRSPIMKMQ
jgi:hypothetical protein